MLPREKGYAVYTPMVMYWPAGTREGSARKAETWPQSMSGRVGDGAKNLSQSVLKLGPRELISFSEGRSLAQISRERKTLAFCLLNRIEDGMA